MNYYNELDPFAAAWLRALIAADQIASGHVDERDIREVTPDDLRGYRQCHFFAGIGGWSYALRLAGWADAAPVWTGSCPCQPFSAAGKGQGEADERHLWPEFARLIRLCRPAVVFGEQVASPAGLQWLDLVSADLEDAGYAVGAADLCAASLGAPHIRQRLFFVADANGGHSSAEGLQCGREHGLLSPHGQSGVMADALSAGRAKGRAFTGDGSAAGSGLTHLMGDPGGEGLARPSRQSRDDGEEQPTAERAGGSIGRLGNAEKYGERPFLGQSGQNAGQQVSPGRSGVPGFWSDCDWLPCRDGKARPVEPGTFPLASGLPARVGRLRGYGNAIVPQAAEAFIRAYLEARYAAP